MAKQVMLVYQDCPMCGARKGWGEEQTKIANTHGIEIIKFPFFKSGAKEWIWDAAKSGVTLPFFTDGKKFSKKLEDFIEKPKRTRRIRKKIEEKPKDGAISED